MSGEQVPQLAGGGSQRDEGEREATDEGQRSRERNSPDTPTRVWFLSGETPDAGADQLRDVDGGQRQHAGREKREKPRQERRRQSRPTSHRVIPRVIPRVPGIE